jgi:hypothetical protein
MLACASCVHGVSLAEGQSPGHAAAEAVAADEALVHEGSVGVASPVAGHGGGPMGVGMDVDLSTYTRNTRKNKEGKKQAKGSICVSAPPDQGQYGPLRDRRCDEDLDGTANSTQYALVPHFKHLLQRQEGCLLCARPSLLVPAPVASRTCHVCVLIQNQNQILHIYRFQTALPVAVDNGRVNPAVCLLQRCKEHPVCGHSL